MKFEDLKIVFPAAPDTWHVHMNGGGWVENTTSVAETVYVGRDAIVSGNARVTANATISGNGIIKNY